MSGQPSFAEVFAEACRIKGIASGPGVMLGKSRYPDKEFGHALLTVGGIEDVLWFNEGGLSFTNLQGLRIRYSWDELNFILPEDVSVVGDMLKTFSDVDKVADHFSRTTASAVVKGGLYLIAAYSLFSLFASMSHWFDSLSGIAGMAITAVLLALLMSMGVIPALLAVVTTASTVGGIIAAVTSAIRGAIMPFAKSYYARYATFSNGITIVGRTWIKVPWGLPTTELLDLVLLGMKLRRRGIA